MAHHVRPRCRWTKNMLQGKDMLLRKEVHNEETRPANSAKTTDTIIANYVPVPYSGGHWGFTVSTRISAWSPSLRNTGHTRYRRWSLLLVSPIFAPGRRVVKLQKDLQKHGRTTCCTFMLALSGVAIAFLKWSGSEEEFFFIFKGLCLSRIRWISGLRHTPNVSCANKCVFCWRNHINPVALNWKYDVDDPEATASEPLEKEGEGAGWPPHRKALFTD
eukprot:3541559-Amphidinium_carterae.2